MPDFPPPATEAEVAEQTDVFLSLVTTVLLGGDERGVGVAMAMLDAHLDESRDPCRSCMSLAAIGPLIAGQCIRALMPVQPDYWALKPPACASPEELAAYRAVTARLNGDKETAVAVQFALHAEAGCTAVRGMVIAAVILCAGLERERQGISDADIPH